MRGVWESIWPRCVNQVCARSKGASGFCICGKDRAADFGTPRWSRRGNQQVARSTGPRSANRTTGCQVISSASTRARPSSVYRILRYARSTATKTVLFKRHMANIKTDARRWRQFGDGSLCAIIIMLRETCADSNTSTTYYMFYAKPHTIWFRSITP